MDMSIKTTAGYDVQVGMNPRASRAPAQDSKINAVCMEMESLFIQNMFKEMRATIPKGGLISGGKAEEMFRDVLDAELAKSFSASGGIGLSSMIRRQLESVPEIGSVNPGK